MEEESISGTGNRLLYQVAEKYDLSISQNVI